MSTPALDRLAAVHGEMRAIEEFLEWLSEQGLFIAMWEDVGRIEPRGMPIGESAHDVVACYLGVDLAEVERERRGLLDELARG